jgi:AraC-like DNA-binding protein
MILKDILPSLPLTDYVRKHQVIRFQFGAKEILPFKAYSPRPEQCLIFLLRDRQNIAYPQQMSLLTHPKCTINGQHTFITNRYIAYDFWALQIVFQPGALYRLTGIPSFELTNTFIDAEAVWGKEIRNVYEEMCNYEEIEPTIKLAESFLLKLIEKSKLNPHSIDKVSQRLFQQPKLMSVDDWADEACLSVRQFNRVFMERVGVSPKVYARIVRFERAFRLKNAHPDWDWLSIALACGYYDYQHLVKDYKDFTFLNPTDFFETDKKAPERIFGLKED